MNMVIFSNNKQVKIVFGQSASGKTTMINHLIELSEGAGVTSASFQDGLELISLVARDTEAQFHIKAPKGDGEGFMVTSTGFYQKALDGVCEQVLEALGKFDRIFVEISCGGNDEVDFSLAKRLEGIPDEILESSQLIYIKASQEKRHEWNRERPFKWRLPKVVMEAYSCNDETEAAMIQGLQMRDIPITIIENNKTLRDFVDEVNLLHLTHEGCAKSNGPERS